MVWWLSPRAYQTVLYRIVCYLKKIKSTSLVTVWNALGLNQQTTVSLNYSQSIKINIGPSDSGTIISLSRRLTVLNQRLTDFWIEGQGVLVLKLNIFWQQIIYPYSMRQNLFVYLNKAFDFLTIFCKLARSCFRFLFWRFLLLHASYNLVFLYSDWLLTSFVQTNLSLATFNLT